MPEADWLPCTGCGEPVEPGGQSNGRCADCGEPMCDDCTCTCDYCDQGVCPRCYDDRHEEECEDAPEHDWD